MKPEGMEVSHGMGICRHRWWRNPGFGALNRLDNFDGQNTSVAGVQLIEEQNLHGKSKSS